jgi:predicted  nucleic acid-binding Zn-ribbon protein
MYAVVGCGDCGSFWVVEDRPETTRCPSCGTRHRFDSLKKFAETDDADAAREARTALLTGRSEHAPDEMDSFAELESRAETGGMSDDEYLERAGLDAERVREAGERTTGSQSRMDIVREAPAALDRPTEDEIITYALERDVPTEFTERALEKLVRRGAVSEHRGRYRLL